MTTVQSPDGLASAAAVSGGQLVAHWPLQVDLPAGVFVEGVERHALAIDQRFAFGRIGRCCRRGLRQRGGDAEQNAGSEKDRKSLRMKSPSCLTLTRF